MHVSRIIATAALLLYVSVTQTGAQVPDNCQLQRLADPARHVLRCEGGLAIEIGTATELGYVDQSDGPPSRVTVKRGTVLIDVMPGASAPQIRTPHAIAAVRGTVYAVDVNASTTAVFVVRGAVDVRQPGMPGRSVVLGPGQGVDVSPGQPLEVKFWPETRIRALLSHFGR